jgi:hypothetical protein
MTTIAPMIPLTLDKPRNLRLTNRALMAAELRLGELYKDRRVAIMDVVAQAVKGGGIATTTLVVLLHQGLLHEDPTLTEDQVADMTGGLLDMPALATAVFAALTRGGAPDENGATPVVTAGAV